MVAGDEAADELEKPVPIGATAEPLLLLSGVVPLDEAAPLEVVEAGALPTALDCWPCGVLLLPEPLLCWPAVALFLGFELWCVPPTTPPTTAAMMMTMMATMMMMPRRVRYHGTFATTGSWPFDSSLRA